MSGASCPECAKLRTALAESRMLSEQRRRRIEGLLADLEWRRLTTPARDHRWVTGREERTWFCAVCETLTRDRYEVEVTCAEIQERREAFTRHGDAVRVGQLRRTDPAAEL